MALNEAQKRERSEYLERNLAITECSQGKPYVFISYASDNWEKVFKGAVIPLQQTYGLRVYADKAFDKVNDRWIVPMLRNIRGAAAVMVFVSQPYIESYACFLELLTAVNSKKPIIFISLEDSLHLGNTTDQPEVERGVKNEILNQGANLATNTNNTSNDLMRAMKSAYTSISTLLEQDALSRFDISDAFINFFRDASVNRKTMNDLKAVKRTIGSVSKDVFDKALIIRQEDSAEKVQEEVLPAAGRAAEQQPAQVEAPETRAEQPGVQEEKGVQEVRPAQPGKPEGDQEAQNQQPGVQEEEDVQETQAEQQPAETAAPDFSFAQTGKESSRRNLLIGGIAGGVALIAVIVVIVVMVVNSRVREVNGVKYAVGNGNTGEYTGSWQHGAPEGEGKIVYSNGNVYEGEWEDGKPNGQGTASYTNGNVYEGEWEDGERNGQGTMTYANGDVYEGEWKDGKKEGQGTITFAEDDASNRVSYEGEWKEDKREGQGKMIWDDGAVYEGEWKNDTLNGQGKYTWADGRVYEGEYQNGKKEGQGTITFAEDDASNRVSYEGEWKEDKREGQGKMIWDDGAVYEGEWEDGKPNGQGKYTWADGRVYEGEWKEGKQNGQGKFTYANGDVYEGEFQNGKQNGRGTMTYANGLVYEGGWKDDKKSGQGKLTWPSGQVYEGEFADDKYNGHGKLIWAGNEYEGEWKDGKRNGHGIQIDDVGNVWEGEWTDDKKNGQGVWTWPDGTQVEETWVNGEKQ